MDAKRDIPEWLHNHPEFAAPLERLIEELELTRKEATFLDDIEERLREAQRRVMPELLKTLVEARGREAEAKVMQAAQTVRHRKKSC
jgi:uncharacterized protein YigA (DUF484 family)